MNTQSIWLENGRKFCLPIEFDTSPLPLMGKEVLAQLEETNFTYGKGQSNMEVDEKDEEQI